MSSKEGRDESRTIRFAQISDTHIRADGSAFRGVDTVAALERAVELLGDSYDFVVHTGDVISRPASRHSYRAYRSIISGMSLPIWHIPGNHDESETMRKELAMGNERFPWQFVLGGVQFIGVDSSTGTIGPDQGERLAQLLSAEGPAILFIHHHVCSLGESWLNKFALEDTELLGEILRRGKADLLGILHGHIHHYGRFHAFGVPVYSAPALTAQFDPYGEPLSTTEDSPAFLECTLNGTGRLERVLHTCNINGAAQHQQQPRSKESDNE